MSQILKNLVEAKMKEEKLSLRKAGDKAGVAHTTIQRVLDDESLDLATVEKVCDWLGVPVSAVLNTESEEFNMAKEISILFAKNDEFAEVFSSLAKHLELGAIDSTILAEITAFTAFRIDQQLKKKKKISVEST